MDSRGQGFSGRELDDPHKGYVKDFDDYVRDEKNFTGLLTSGSPRLQRR